MTVLIRFVAPILAALLFFCQPALSAPNTVELMGGKLRTGELKGLEDDLAARLAATPADDQLRLALGATQFLRTVEAMAQAMYHLLTDDALRNVFVQRGFTQAKRFTWQETARKTLDVYERITHE